MQNIEIIDNFFDTLLRITRKNLKFENEKDEILQINSKIYSEINPIIIRAQEMSNKIKGAREEMLKKIVEIENKLN